MAVITSRKNPRIKEWMQLAKKAYNGRILVEGAHLFSEALKSEVEIETIVYVPRRLNTEVEVLLEIALEKSIEIVEVSEDCYKKFSQLNSSERVALVVKRNEFKFDSFLQECQKIVVLENIQDPGNAGAIVRVAEASGIDGCVFLGGVSGGNGKFLRATMGAAFRVPCVWVGMEEFIPVIESSDIELSVTELNHHAVSFLDADYGFAANRTVGICFGSEGKGISPELKQLAIQSIYIPMAGAVESLNVAVAAGIVLYHIMQRYQKDN